MREKQQNFGLNQRDARDTLMQSNVRENCESAKELIKAYKAEAGSLIEIIKPELGTIINEKDKGNLLNKITEAGAFELGKEYEIKLFKEDKKSMRHA